MSSTAPPLVIRAAGATTAIGLDLRNSAAALRCGLSNIAETAFLDHAGSRIRGSAVPLDPPLRGFDRLERLVRMALANCIDTQTPFDRDGTALCLCLASPDRPGRVDGLDECMQAVVQDATGTTWTPQCRIIAADRCGALLAMEHAQQILALGAVRQVLIVGADSYLTADTLNTLLDQDRLLTPEHSDGFIPGEAAAAILVSPAQADDAGKLACLGFATADEPSPRDSGRANRAEGLSRAIRQSSTRAGLAINACDWHASDADGSQFAFREISAAVARCLTERKPDFPHLTPIDCLGQVGAAFLPCVIAILTEAHRLGWAAGPATLCHVADDGAPRGALILAPVPAQG